MAAGGLRAAADEAALALNGLGRGGDGDELRGSGQQILVGVRMPLFIFFLAEELSRSFFPIFAKQLYTPVLGLSAEIVISLPMMLFMLVVALSQPLAGPWVERLGSRRLMIAGAALGAAGLAMTALADGFAMLIVWRLVTAAGYGIVFVAGQSHVIANTTAGNRAWGLAMFVGSVLAASICGPAIGGILADRVGFRATFVVGALLAVLAALIALKVLAAAQPKRSAAVRGLRVADIGLVVRNVRFTSLVGLGAMPAKIILTGYLYYLAPLYLADLGNSPSATGRIMMLYGLMMVLLTPFAARLVDRVGHRLAFVSLGGLVAGAGVICISASPSTEMMLLAILILGAAQAISITPQLALVPEACPDECGEIGQATVMGFFRLFERIGSALGPPIAAFLLHQFGFVFAIVAIGAGVAAGCVLLPMIWRLSAQRATARLGALAAR
jgi:MFS family permease